MSGPERASLEQRLVADELRLTRDEARLETEEREVRDSRIVGWLGVALALITAVAVAALVVAILALREDVGAIEHEAPANSVGTAALRDGTVTAQKLAPGVVDTGPVTAAKVAPNTLTGAQIAEHTLGTVPAAKNAQRLGGVRASAYVSHPFEITAASVTNATHVKGPLVAQCPSGSRMLSGGATIEGAGHDAALLSSAPAGHEAWTARARVGAQPPSAWRLVVTVVCAEGGN